MGYGLLAALYLLSFQYHPGLRSPNELCRLWQSRAIVDHGTLVLNQTMRELGPVGDLSVREGLYYPSKAPMLSFLGVPVYAALKAMGPVSEVGQVFWSRLFITVLPSLFLLWLLRRFLLTYVSTVFADACLLTYGLGTIAFSYSTQFLSHQLTAVLTFAAFYACWRVERGEWPLKGYAVAGALTGAAVMTEYTGALTVLCLSVYVVVARARAQGAKPLAVKIKSLLAPTGWVLLGGAPFLAGLMAYHQACFGHPLASGYKFLADTAYQGWHVGGFLGIKLPKPEAFLHSYFSPLRGLLAVSPALTVAFWGFKPLKAERAMFWFVLVLLAANTYFTSSFDHTSWGWTTGPRHLTPLLPFLLLPMALGFKRLVEGPNAESRFGYGAAAGLCVTTVVVGGTAALINYVPDSVSTTLFGLAVPLFEEGFWPISLLSFFGLTNPAGGMMLVGLLLTSALWVASLLLVQAPENGRATVRIGLVLAALLHLGILGSVSKAAATVAAADPQKQFDFGARSHLKSVWLVRPGEAVPAGVHLR
ncbi:MAG: hypothetical protein K1X64_22700 [Myxococcaceae bacterium]|nr:hypothetical protein [Myxococcaceae bacterium]